MVKIAFVALLLAGIIGWSVRDDASSVVTEFMPGVLKADCF